MSRIKAAVIHFIISLTIVSAIVIVMLTLWYPHAYLDLMGGKTLIYLIAGVDIFLGPLLTLAVFDANKKLIKFDLTCIAVLQIAAMSYGFYVMFQARPIFTVYNKNAFYVASVVDIVPSELAKGKRKEWRTASLTGPKLAAAKPDSNSKYETIFYETESQTNTIQQYPIFYDDYKNHLASVIKAGKPLAELAKISPDNKRAVDRLLTKKKQTSGDFLFLPIYAVTGEMSAIVDAKTGEFIEIIDATK